MFRRWIFAFLLIPALLLSACGPAATPAPTEPAAAPTTAPAEPTSAPAEPRTLTVMTHDSFDVSEEVVQAFEQANNVKVTFIQGGDTGSALNKVILSQGNPPADVFYGVDNTFLSRALEEDIFVPYESPLLAQIDDSFELDPQHRALPVDYGDVCLNYDVAYFADKGLQPPATLEDLLKPEYKDLLVVENPATSSPGLAFLLATVGHFGTDGYLQFWQGLKDNGVKVVDGWESAYYTEFTRWDGTRPIVVSYGSSPAFEVIYADPPVDEPPTAAVVGDETCFRQIEFVGILKGTQNEDLAQKWVDFMLDAQFQADMPLKMFVFPVNPNAQLDEAFVKYLAVPEKPAYVAPQDIAANRDAWIQAWTETVLR
ncbi:MAG: thiamine ABC transporter substrate-binding protein [Anaerolineae bacterium]|nr:MAG: thiamine ABC transporter substrate-binding protein [Anaerolineae bacterium]